MHYHRLLLNGDRRGDSNRDGLGRFYRARDTPLDRHVAVKALSTPELCTEGRTRLDWAEARLACGEPSDHGGATPCPASP